MGKNKHTPGNQGIQKKKLGTGHNHLISSPITPSAPIKPLLPDIAATPPRWYERTLESTLLWGSLGTAIGIVLVVAAAMTKDLRGLLILAWPFFCLAAWAIVKGSGVKRLARITVVASVIIGASLYGLNRLLAPTPERQTFSNADSGGQSNAKPPKISVAAFIGPGNYGDGDVFGIRWHNDFFSEIRLKITNDSNIDVVTLNLYMRTDEDLCGIANLSTLTGVETQILSGSNITPLSLGATNGKNLPLPETPLNGEKGRVSCSRLPKHEHISLLVAAAVLNQAVWINNRATMPNKMFAPKRPPKFIYINGTYETAPLDGGNRFPVDVHVVL
jgi:hypothetical protein